MNSKTKKHGGIKKAVIIVLALILAFAVVFVIASFFGTMPFSGVFARIGAYFSGDDGSAFPIEVDSANTLAIDSCPGGFYILSDTDIKIYDQTGSLRLTEQYTYTSPAICAGEYGTVVYDRDGTGYMIIKKYKLVFQGDSGGGNILTVTVGKNGNRAFSVRSSDATSVLKVTDSKANDLFIFNCAYEHIISIALSDDGKYIAAASIGAEDGDIMSTVYVFSYDYKEALYTHIFEGETVINVRFLSNSLLNIFTDGGIYTVKKLDELTEVKTFYSSELGYFSNADNGISVLASTKYGSSNLCELFVTDKKGKELFTKDVEKSVSDVYTNGKYVFLLADNNVLVYNLNGECINEIELSADTEKIFANNRYVYFCSSDKISREFAIGSDTEEETG